MVTSTRLSQKPCESWTCYGCTKSVINYLCSCIPLEDGRIRCVAITPGAVDTDMQTQMREEGTYDSIGIMGSVAEAEINAGNEAVWTLISDSVIGKASPVMQKFLNALEAEGKLLKPEESASAFVKLVETGIPDAMNGKTVYWETITSGVDGA